MKNERLGTIWTGLALIGLGIVFFLAIFVGWDRAWPVFVLAGGLAFWLGYFLSGARDGGLAFVGTGAVLVGLFFFGFTFGVWEWEEMADLWPVFPLIGGVAFVVLFFAERRASGRDWGVLGLGLAAVIVGVVGWLSTHGQLPHDLWRYWPVLLILVGVFGLLGGVLPRARRR